ncbi:MAG: DUF2934 domain-containing protein [Candidatus Sulfotelmatobacter sp.]|jgi:hypothetical protein
MARAKSTSGGKSSRTSKEQTGVNNAAGIPDVNAVAAPETAPTDVRPETKITPEPKKFEVRKTEPRKNVVPINLEDEIRRRAYELYQQRGSGSGSEAEDWLTAEREVMQRYHQQSA